MFKLWCMNQDTPRHIDILRRDYVNKWTLRKQNVQDLYFPFEKYILYPRINSYEGDIFVPVKVKALQNDDYNIRLSCLISALDSLPRHIDIAFDCMWRGFENSIRISAADGNITEHVRRTAIKYSQEGTSRKIIDKFLNAMPVQSWEFVTKTIADDLCPSTDISCLLGVSKRIVYADDSKYKRVAFHRFLCLWHKKYFTQKSADNSRKAAICLRHYFRDESVTMGGETFHATDLDKASLLFNGLLYSFRNDRTHVKSMAPFVSSKASLKTYAHCHFAFLVAYFAFLYSGLLPCGISLINICKNVDENIENFKLFYAGLLNR